jgi:hypothetical protein
MGFALPGCSGKDLGGSFLPPPLTRFVDWHVTADPPASQSIIRSLLSLLRPPMRSTGTGQSNPLRVSAPASSRTLKRDADLAMNSPPAGSHIAADAPTVFGRVPSLYRSRRDGLRCRAFALASAQSALPLPELLSCRAPRFGDRGNFAFNCLAALVCYFPV